MKFAIADPPYIGQSKKFYSHHPDYAGEVDHQALINRLIADYPDGWMLCLSSPTLKTVLNMIPEGYDYRIGAWVKPFCVYKKGVRPAYAWEPVIFHGGRNKNHPPPPKGGRATTPKDFVSANITLKRGLVGVKPDAFVRWCLDILGVKLGDIVESPFPGTGTVARVWSQWCAEHAAELECERVLPLTFHEAIEQVCHQARGGRLLSEQLTAYKVQDYVEMQCHLTSDHLTGFALHDGELINLFNLGTRGAGEHALEQAVELGAVRLNCFDQEGFLPTLYARHGFHEVRRVPWDEQYGSGLADGSRPDVVYMERTVPKELAA